MRTVFADSLYWIAIVRPSDPWGGSAKAARERLGGVLLATTDEVLTEFLAALSCGGPRLRQMAVEMVRAILSNPNVKVVPQARDGFLEGLKRYESRQDKEYSLTDCISMNVMEAEGISEILTNDHHFEQEGLTVLIERHPGA
ncbi:MAG TPA: nucleic acid-binding protein [Phycisphaerae bacterium]|nr:nucleic acid-binding protein [Phycisphaerae bacterium]